MLSPVSGEKSVVTAEKQELLPSGDDCLCL